VCYNGTGVGLGSLDTYGTQWFDSFIRLRFSEISSVTHHGAEHTTQGHVPNSNHFGLTYTGKLAGANYVALTEDTQNSYQPCSAPVSDTSLSTGAVLAVVKMAIFDTTSLNTRKNFAVCYGADSSSMYDSGIRVTVATMNGLRYNFDQYSDFIPERRYERSMYSTNVPTTSCTTQTCGHDTEPPATNRLPVPGGNRSYEFTGVNSLSNVQSIVIIDASRNNNNPCMNFTEISFYVDIHKESQASWGFTSGSLTSRSGSHPRRFLISDEIKLSKDVDRYTTCYCNVNHNTMYNHHAYNHDVNGVDFTTCRDSYIHMKPTDVQTITAYGQTHKTIGSIPSRLLLGLQVNRKLDSGFSATDCASGASCTDKINLQEESLNSYHPCATGAMTTGVNGTGPSSEKIGASGTFVVETQHLSPVNVFAVCYSRDSGVTYEDAGIRLTVPQIQSISYGTPVRILKADTCFSGASEFGLPRAGGGEIANCYASVSMTSKRNSQLPQSHQMHLIYNGHSSYSPLPDGYLIRFVDHELGHNDPCCTGAVDGTVDSKQWTVDGTVDPHSWSNGTVDRRLSTASLMTATGRTATVNLPEGYFMDYTKTFAVCYSSGTNLNVKDMQWRDSFVRVTWSHIHTLKIHKDQNMAITTKGMIPAVAQLRIEWAYSSLSMPEGDNSNHHSPWLRLTAENQNGGFPCEKENADQVVGVNSTNSKQVLNPTNEFVNLDTSLLGSSTGVHSFAVCVATGNGTIADATWEDSGLRVRVVRWANSAKSRVVAGAPAILYYDLNTGDFDTNNGKVALLAYDTFGAKVTDCSTAKDVLQNVNPYYSTGNTVMRQIDYRCKTVGLSADSTCDAGGTFKAMDEVSSDKCLVGAICAPGDNAGGCGHDGGECSAAIQLPTGKPYTGLRKNHKVGVWVEQTLVESELQSGSYAMCVCDDLNGNGGCDDSNEWTVVFSSNDTIPDPLDPGTAYGGNLHVIARPRLGNHGSHGNVRHLQNRSHQYNIRAGDNKTGYNVQNKDRIYFAPAHLGCGQATSYVGSSDYENWRTMPTAVCTTLGTSPTAACDSDNDGRYDELCTHGAFCKVWDSSGDGCGSGGVCASSRVSSHQPDQTAPIKLTHLNGHTTATVVTPSQTAGAHRNGLTVAQTMVACYATKQSFYSNDPTVQSEEGDYAQLDDTLEVITLPKVGPGDSLRWHINQGIYLPTTSIRALENTSPKFKVNSLAEGDLMYFMPRRQPPGDDGSWEDCTPFMCTVSSGSLIAPTGCDDDFDGYFNDTCSEWAACDPNAANNGGCGVSGRCERTIPSNNHRSFTKPMEGTSFASGAGLIQLPTDVTLNTWGAANDTSCTVGLGKHGGTGTTYGATPNCQPGSARYLVSCFIPKGAIVQSSNVARLSEDLTVLKEPTAALRETYHQGKIYNLDFTSPQQGDFDKPDLKEFSTGLAGDCVVLTQATDCSQAYDVSQDSYFVGLYFNTKTGQYEDQHRSMMMSLDQADSDKSVMGDIKGGIASYEALAQGKVNELPEGTYKICYATMNSECDNPEDFSMLTKEIEILPRSDTAATLRAQMMVQLGHDILVDWSSNNGLSTQDMIGKTWVGLYDKGACIDTQPQTLRHQCQPEGGRQQPIAYRSLETVKMLGGYCETTADCFPAEWKAKCDQHHDPTDTACDSGSHISMCYKNQCTGGTDRGTVRFDVSEYAQAGDYEVRLFQGDARNKNGIFCGGITGTPHETYTQCVYESSVNASIKVYTGEDNLADLNAVVGIEMYFSGALRTMAKAPKVDG